MKLIYKGLKYEIVILKLGPLKLNKVLCKTKFYGLLNKIIFIVFLLINLSFALESNMVTANVLVILLTSSEVVLIQRKRLKTLTMCIGQK